ncbi:MAG: DUF3307 domain-containing protein [Spirochaetales bacterium]|nr:DUF3307 domain-containing protein [Spirochaetales bacterium]
MSISLLVLLAMHVLGDFYFQSDKLALRKRQEITAVFIHSLIYTIAFLPMVFISSWYVFLILVLSHAVIDFLKYVLMHVTARNSVLFILDQLGHIAVLAGVSVWAFPDFPMEIRYVSALRIIVLVLWVAKPVSVLFSELFGRFRPLPGEGTEGAGKVIGYLERLMLVLLLIIGQYGVIGWVIAAKTLARSKQLSDSQAFCEYFLVGTLFSILSTISLFLVLYRW